MSARTISASDNMTHGTSTYFSAGAEAIEPFRKYVAELVASNPDVVVGTAHSIVADFEQISRTFVTTIDPIGSGLVASLVRPAATPRQRAINQEGTQRRGVTLSANSLIV